jgi:N-acetylglucosaminyldiphosphoundecaprenol N-acetyl-beta-D-mannosaminyltransferase
MVAVTQPSIEQTSRVRLGEIGLDRITEPQAMQRIEEFIVSGQPSQVVTANLRFLTLARRDTSFARIVNNSSLVVADGIPLIWVSRVAGAALPARITGGTLLDACVQLAIRKNYSFFLLGASPGVAEQAGKRLQEQYPGLQIAGTHHGYFSAEENEGIVRKIHAARPVFLFVAMGCPKQEQWIAENLAELQVPVCIGIGGTLEIVTGRLKRAPKWMQSAGLEWFYRLIQEPGRLWKRYLLEDVPTGMRVTLSATWRRVRGKRRI